LVEFIFAIDSLLAEDEDLRDNAGAQPSHAPSIGSVKQSVVFLSYREHNSWDAKRIAKHLFTEFF